jgi:hypothetical protein
MSQEPTIKLQHAAARREDFEAVRFVAGDPCICDPRAKLLAGEVCPRILCKPCRARKLMNDLVAESEKN